jgi:excisionase family DNA binding protein
LFAKFGALARRLIVEADALNPTLPNAGRTLVGADLSVSDAALALQVTTQTIRNWIENGKLEATKRGARWRVSRASFDRLAGSFGDVRDSSEAAETLEERLDRLAIAVEQLSARESTSQQLVDTLSRERDRYRSDAAAAREAALLVNAAARDTDVAVRHLLAVLESQSDALAQLLAPGSPQDLMS